MDYYFVAKNKDGGFIGQLTLEDIVGKFRSGELSGSHVVARSSGGSYHEALKSGTTTWMNVAELVANPPTPINPLAQTGTTQLLTKQVIALTHRYNDAYLVARVTNGFGGIIKGMGVIRRCPAWDRRAHVHCERASRGRNIRYRCFNNCLWSYCWCLVLYHRRSRFGTRPNSQGFARQCRE